MDSVTSSQHTSSSSDSRWKIGGTRLGVQLRLGKTFVAVSPVNADGKIAPDHELMFAARERSREAQVPEAVNEFYSADRSEMWH